MIFKKGKKKVGKSIKKVDKIVTSIIVGGAVVSIFGLSKTKKGKKLTGRIFDLGKNIFKSGYSNFGKAFAKTISFLFKKK